MDEADLPPASGSEVKMIVAASTVCHVHYAVPLNEVQGQLLCIYSKILVIV